MSAALDGWIRANTSRLSTFRERFQRSSRQWDEEDQGIFLIWICAWIWIFDLGIGGPGLFRALTRVTRTPPLGGGVLGSLAGSRLKNEIDEMMMVVFSF